MFRGAKLKIKNLIFILTGTITQVPLPVLVKAATVAALLNRQHYVTPSIVAGIAADVLAHRITINVDEYRRRRAKAAIPLC